MFTPFKPKLMMKTPAFQRLRAMSEASKIVIDQALELPASERLVVAEQILLSLNRPDAKNDALWLAETEARIDAYERGEIEAIPAGEVLGKR